MNKTLNHIGKAVSAMLLCLFCNAALLAQTYDKDTDNRIGSSAVDFNYTDKEGEHTLYELIESRKTNVLVLFHSPDCEDCAKVKRRLAKRRSLRKAVENGELTVLLVAVETDKAKWKATCSKLPEEWVNAYCEECTPITKSYIWTVPTFFLIGKDAKVIDREFEHNEKNKYN